MPRWKPRSKIGVCLGKSSERAGNVSLMLDPKIMFFLPQFYLAHDDDFTSVRPKRIEMLPPNWNNLFKCHEKVSDNELMNTPLTETIENEEDKTVKARLKFADPTFTLPNDDISCNNINDTPPKNEDVLEALSGEKIAIYFESELSNNHFDNAHDNDENQKSVLDGSSQVYEAEILTRTGRRIIKPKRYSNCILLFSCLITSQFINSNDGVLETNKYTHISLFKAQMDYKSSLDAIFDGTSNSFEPLAHLANESNNNTLYCGKSMKAHENR